MSNEPVETTEGEAREILLPRGKVLRLVQLDFLRGVAILLVIGHHLRNPPAQVMSDQAGRLHPLALFLEKSGWVGVDLFFVLSGFLIGGLLFAEIRKTGGLDARRFILRRGLKIWPLYYLLLFIATAALPFWKDVRMADDPNAPLPPIWVLLWPNYLHVQNYVRTDLPAFGYLGQTWTLAIEEHFYLALPLLLLWLLRPRRNGSHSLHRLPLYALFVCIACLLARLWTAQYPWRFITHDSPTHLRMDSLFFGVLLAYGWHFHPTTLQPVLRRPFLLLLAGILLLIPMAYRYIDDPFTCTWGYTLLYLGFGSVLMAVMSTTLHAEQRHPLARFFTGKTASIIAWIGFYSYPIYLFHMWAKLPLEGFLQYHPFGHPSVAKWILIYALFLLFSVLLGVVAGKLIERPVLALRDRMFPTNR